MKMAVQHVNEGSFGKEVEKSKTPVIVDFWATWCGPCRMMAPVFEKMSGEYQGKLKFVKVDTDENQGLASRFGIMSIPTLLVFKDGKPVSQLVGFRPEPVFRKDLEKIAKEL
jgi:thioredoxin 1